MKNQSKPRNRKPSFTNMDLLNKQVYHQQFKSGKIIRVSYPKLISDDMYFYVKFDEYPAEEKKFVFPNAFKEYLNFTNETDQKEIKKILHSIMCIGCNQIDNNLTEINGNFFCEKCIKYFTKCDNCKKYIQIDKRFDNQPTTYFSTMPFNDKKYCSSCFEKLHQKCIICNNWTLKDEMPDLPDKRTICKWCAESKYFRCSYCGKYLLTNPTPFNYKGKYICKECVDKHTHTCDICNKQLFFPLNNKYNYLCEKCLDSEETKDYIKFVKSLRKQVTEYITSYEFIDTKSEPLFTRLADFVKTGFNPNRLTEKRWFNVLLIDYFGTILIITNILNSSYIKNKAVKLPLKNKNNTVSSLKNEFRNFHSTAIMDLELNTHILCESKVRDNITLKIFETPFILRAITNYDKDYRKEWIGGVLEYYGNDYGDTSDFYVVGCYDVDYNKPFNYKMLADTIYKVGEPHQ